MNNTRIEGAKFGLFDHCGRHIASGCTNKHGEIDFDGLPFGRYLVKQLDRSGEFEQGTECMEVVIDKRHRCQTVEFVNVMRLGGIRVRLSGRTEHCHHKPHDNHKPNCNSPKPTCRSHRERGVDDSQEGWLV